MQIGVTLMRLTNLIIFEFVIRSNIGTLNFVWILYTLKNWRKAKFIH